MSDELGALNVAVLPGDGIGPEVVEQGVRVLKAVCEIRRRPLELLELDLGADRFLEDGISFPDAVAEEIRDNCDAVLLGALGDPRVPDLGYARDILFGLRFGMDLYANIRPVRCLHDSLMPLRGKGAAHCRFTVFRENTEGSYAGIGGQLHQGSPDEIAIVEDINTARGVERILRCAFAFAEETGATQVHMADKSNAMGQAHQLWRRMLQEVAADFEGIEPIPMYVDALCYQLVRAPEQFQVIVTNNLFGDIVTDLAAALQGGLGMAGSLNWRPGAPALVEPVHGSAPDLVGKGIANPFATVLSVSLMMHALGDREAEAALEALVKAAVEEGVCTPDIGGTASCEEVGNWLVDHLPDFL